jgi:hypothetical protein
MKLWLLRGGQGSAWLASSLNMVCQQSPGQLPPGHLATLTRLNIEVMTWLRDRLPTGTRDRLHLAVYDETIRFNIILVDDHTCVVQPYLPQARGVDSPTIMLRHNESAEGLYPTFEQVYEAIAQRSRPL